MWRLPCGPAQRDRGTWLKGMVFLLCRRLRSACASFFFSYCPWSTCYCCCVTYLSRVIGAVYLCRACLPSPITILSFLIVLPTPTQVLAPHLFISFHYPAIRSTLQNQTCVLAQAAQNTVWILPAPSLASPRFCLTWTLM